jgi:hypothetical protein
MDIKEKARKLSVYGLPSYDSFRLIVGMTGLPAGGFAVLGDPKGGRPHSIGKPFGLFCFCSLHAFEQARRAPLQKQPPLRGGFAN